MFDMGFNTQRGRTMLAVLSATVVAWASTAPCAAAAGATATIELVPRSVASPNDTAATLPSPLTTVAAQESFVIEVWAQTIDPQGLSSVSTTIQLDPLLTSIVGVAPSMVFSELTGADIDNVIGTVANLTGSHLSSCTDQIGIAPNWTRVAVISMLATSPGTLAASAADTGNIALGTAICGVGDLAPAQVGYGSTFVSITAPLIPTTSHWGLAILSLLVLVAGTTVLNRRRIAA